MFKVLVNQKTDFHLLINKIILAFKKNDKKVC